MAQLGTGSSSVWLHSMHVSHSNMPLYHVLPGETLETRLRKQKFYYFRTIILTWCIFPQFCICMHIYFSFSLSNWDLLVHRQPFFLRRKHFSILLKMSNIIFCGFWTFHPFQYSHHHKACTSVIQKLLWNYLKPLPFKLSTGEIQSITFRLDIN